MTVERLSQLREDWKGVPDGEEILAFVDELLPVVRMAAETEERTLRTCPGLWLEQIAIKARRIIAAAESLKEAQ